MSPAPLVPGQCSISAAVVRGAPMGGSVELLASFGMPVERWRTHTFPDPRFRFEESTNPTTGELTVNWCPRSERERHCDPLNLCGHLGWEAARQHQSDWIYARLREQSPARPRRPGPLPRIRAFLARVAGSLRRLARRF